MICEFCQVEITEPVCVACGVDNGASFSNALLCFSCPSFVKQGLACIFHSEREGVDRRRCGETACIISQPPKRPTNVPAPRGKTPENFKPVA